MRLSLCMIVKDEAANLARCLQSVQGIVDEMVILDTGSQDETITIAKSFGAKVYQAPWQNNFSTARNHALQFVTGDWVLVLDADEVLRSAVGPTLKIAIAQPNWLAINLMRHEIGADQSPYSLVSRLFRHHPAIKFTRPYHAMIDDAIEALRQKEPHWQIGELETVAIDHYGYQADVIAGRDKFAKARSMMEGFLAANPQDPYVCSKLGALYIQMGDQEAGMELLQRGLNAPKIDPHTHYELLYHLGCTLGGTLESADYYQQAIQQPIAPKLKLGAMHNLGTLCQEAGDIQAAQHLYEQVLAIDPHLAIAHCHLGMVLKQQGKMVDAMNHYRQAIDLKPSYSEAYQNLGVVLLKMGDVSNSLLAFGRSIELHRQQGNESEAIRLQTTLQEMGFKVG